jgi:hypothetical protein
MSGCADTAPDAIRRPWGARRPAAWRYLRAEARRVLTTVCAASSVNLRQRAGGAVVVLRI